MRAQPAVSGPPLINGEEVPPLPKRRCGRCQCEFDGDPNLYFQTDWALCAPCGDILLPTLHLRRL